MILPYVILVADGSLYTDNSIVCASFVSTSISIYSKHYDLVLVHKIKSISLFTVIHIIHFSPQFICQTVHRFQNPSILLTHSFPRIFNLLSVLHNMVQLVPVARLLVSLRKISVQLIQCHNYGYIIQNQRCEVTHNTHTHT